MFLLAVLSERYLDHLRVARNLSNNTTESYGRDLRALLAALAEEGCIHVEQVTPEHLRAYLVQMAKSGCAAASQRRAISSMRQLFLYAQKERIIAQSPARALEAPQLARTLPKVPTVAEASQLLDALAQDRSPRGLRDWVALEMLYGCGLRASELCNISLDDIDMDLGLVRPRGKAEKVRMVPVGEAALVALRQYLAEGRTQLLAGNSHSFLLVANTGRPLTRMGLFTIVKLRAAAAGLDASVSPHTWRHAFATHLLHGGADLRAVQEMLGHASIATTEIYTHVGEQALQHTVDKHHPLSHGTASFGPSSPGEQDAHA